MMNSTRNWTVAVTIAAVVGSASLHAQDVSTPSEARGPQDAVALTSPIDTRRGNALRVSVAREARRQADAASDQQQKTAAPKESWWTRHKAKVVGIGILAAIGSIVFVAIYTHTGS
jgi:hypothetical protein